MIPAAAAIFFPPILLLSSLPAAHLIPLSLTPFTAPISPSDACSSTTDPIFCRSVLPTGNNQPLYSYSLLSLAKSLSNAVNFLSLINPYIAHRPAFPAATATATALDDCQLLTGLNIDFLTATIATLNSTSAMLPNPEAELFSTLLSATLTNHQTCLDGLIETDKANAVAGVLTPYLIDGIKLFSLSLGLFLKAWDPNRKIRNTFSQRPFGNLAFHPIQAKGMPLLFHEVLIDGDGRLPLKMSEKNQAVFEGRLGRQLLQTPNSVQISDMVVVSPDGTENFTTISDAVASAPKNTNESDGYYLILVRAGVYQEYVSVPKSKRYIMMIGDGINQTVITGNRNVIDGSTTFNSATFAVVGQGFVAINMTFQNTAGAAKHQAVALRSGADLSSFYLCSFEGYQDTLYAHSMRQFYTQCDIYGTIDYVFGNAAVVLQNCNFYSRLPLIGQQNTITAQGRIDPNQNTGTSIQGGGFLSAADLAANIGTTRTYLGRPWKQYSRTVIMSAFMDGLINPAGWLPWNGDFALNTLYYAEYNNYGSGSNTSGRVTWPGYHVLTNSTDALNFTVENFILGDNWLPQTGVPYTSGML